MSTKAKPRKRPYADRKEGIVVTSYAIHRDFLEEVRAFARTQERPINWVILKALASYMEENRQPRK